MKGLKTVRGKSRACIRATSAWLVGVTALLSIEPAGAASPWGADYFPNVPLITQDGTTVRFYDDLLKGKKVAINLIYTSCKDECPLETARLVQVQQLLRDRVGKYVFFYSLSSDPTHDTPAVLKAYAEKFGVGPGWLFLTGTEADLKLVATKLGLTRPNDPATRDGHQPILMLGHEPTGQWMRNSAVASPKYLATTISNFMGWQRPPAERRYTAAQLLSPEAGMLLFQNRCSACHTVGKGDAVGPDLAGVTTRRARDWLVRYLRAPDELLAEQDPIAIALLAQYKDVPMPNLHLNDGEIATVLAYLDAQRVAAPPGRAGPDAAAAR